MTRQNKQARRSLPKVLKGRYIIGMDAVHIPIASKTQPQRGNISETQAGAVHLNGPQRYLLIDSSRRKEPNDIHASPVESPCLPVATCRYVFVR